MQQWACRRMQKTYTTVDLFNQKKMGVAIIEQDQACRLPQEIKPINYGNSKKSFGKKTGS
jgi:hypothetical protein